MNNDMLGQYAEIAGEDVIFQLKLLAKHLKGRKVVHANSTATGGGVAEILTKMVPLMRELGIEAEWLVVHGNEDFFKCTKMFHNALQGASADIPEAMLRNYEETNRENAERLHPALEEADVVIVHDPQPAMLLHWLPNRKGKWIWRCHIDLSRPQRHVWKYLREAVAEYDASVFSLVDFAQPLRHPVYIIPPSIDPLSDKNIELDPAEVAAVRERFKIDPRRPLMLQVSRFDRFKDPLGVIRAWRMARPFVPGLQLVLAGGGAADDPEGQAVQEEARLAASGDEDVHVLLLPPDANRTINALQRSADFVLQKSIREGFGLTVAEAMWKEKAVIGGDTGGIRLQVINHHTGFLVSTPEGAALRIRYLHYHQDKHRQMGIKAKQFVRENFLITRQVREYLALMVGLLLGTTERNVVLT